MINTKNEIRECIKNHISKICKIELEVKDYNENLFQTKYNLLPRDLLLVIIALEDDLGFKITDIFKTNDSSIMTVNHLTELIYECGNNRSS